MARLRSSRAVAVALISFATFIDLVAYSVAVPVLPDLSRKLGASPTMIGLLFASFGVTLLTVSIPMGAVSDRIGRKAPLVGGMLALAAATMLFAYADGLPWLFAARLVQGAADGVTWVVGFALIADRFGPEERGRVSGIVMSGTSAAVMVGPTIGGWQRDRISLVEDPVGTLRDRSGADPRRARIECCGVVRCRRRGHLGNDFDARARPAPVSF